MPSIELIMERWIMVYVSANRNEYVLTAFFYSQNILTLTLGTMQWKLEMRDC